LELLLSLIPWLLWDAPTEAVWWCTDAVVRWGHIWRRTDAVVARRAKVKMNIYVYIVTVAFVLLSCFFVNKYGE
jgi:hypothetical protein